MLNRATISSCESSTFQVKLKLANNTNTKVIEHAWELFYEHIMCIILYQTKIRKIFNTSIKL